MAETDTDTANTGTDTGSTDNSHHMCSYTTVVVVVVVLNHMYNYAPCRYGGTVPAKLIGLGKVNIVAS